MIFNMLFGGDIRGILVQTLLCIPVILISLSLHELSHGLVAYKLGDPTAKNMGRLTMNPLKHLDPIGTIMMFLFGFGYAKPVPVNTRYFKNGRRGMALTALAGPVSNLLLAFVGVIFYNIVRIPDAALALYQVNPSLLAAILLFLQLFYTINISLAVFNLLPIPPLDGSRILFVFLPDRYYYKFMQYERYVMVVVLVLLCTGVMNTPIAFLRDWIITGMQNLLNLLPWFS